jgi:MoaA/NifB/PqqE/SkfB family radical SAM enzyme
MTLWNNIGELMDYYIPPMPSVYWVDITRMCNLRCIMCPQSNGLKRRQARMPMPLFRRFIDDVCHARPLIKLYLSGEPLLHEGLFDMIDYASARQCRTMIHTNATLLTAEIAEKILASPLTSISFSFDGCSAQVYERLRPPARFNHVRSNLLRFLTLREQTPGRGPRTCIEIVRMKETEGCIQDFVREWTSSGIDEVNVVECMTWHGRVADRRVPDSTPATGYKPCAAPFRHGCILADGTVVPCCMDVDGDLPLGNIARTPFHEIWIGKPYRHLRLGLLSGTLPASSICSHCLNTTRPATHLSK